MKHQFILFTRQYIDYCMQNFERCVQHAPSTAPRVERATPLTSSTFELFSERYEQLFGEPLTDPWYDERNVTLGRRILNTRSGTFSLRDDDDMVELLNGKGEPIFAVDQVARETLEFIIRTGTCFVRELPGEFHDEQRIALVSALVEHKVLDLAS